jgi:hypothetical protein
MGAFSCTPKTVGFLTMGPTSLLVTKLDAFVVSTWSTYIARHREAVYACVRVCATSRDPRYMTMGPGFTIQHLVRFARWHQLTLLIQEAEITF